MADEPSRFNEYRESGYFHANTKKSKLDKNLLYEITRATIEWLKRPWSTGFYRRPGTERTTDIGNLQYSIFSCYYAWSCPGWN